jgi:hypothetical protein
LVALVGGWIVVVTIYFFMVGPFLD